ncbi:MAG: GHKL domain-containing protein [Defluviitaleaceae bacterium]|nr:GHKL domain-containing protein [Defluviitaleaceae bacterium]
MSPIVTAVYLISWAVVVFSYGMIIKGVYEERRTGKAMMIVSYLAMYILPVVSFLVIGIPAITAASNLFASFVITVNYKSTLMKRIVITFACFAVIAFADVLATVVTRHGLANFFEPYALEDILEGHAIVGFLLIPTITVTIALLLRKFTKFKKNNVDIPMFWVSALLIPLTIMPMTYFSVVYLSDISAIVAIGIMFAIVVFVLYYQDRLAAAYEDKLKSALHAQEKEYYFTQCKLMQESVENIKTIRHDMKFHLATARDFNISGKADEATDYLNSLLGDIEKKEIYSNTNNTAFDSIINFKLNDVKQENIKLDIRLLIPPALNIEVADIVTILGNLLDNAIDAVKKVEDKQIKLDIEYSNESLFIQVENTFDGEVKYAKEKNGTAEAITTRKSGNNHGYGLKNILKSVEKYNGHIEVIHEENIFSVGVLLYVDE